MSVTVVFADVPVTVIVDTDDGPLPPAGPPPVLFPGDGGAAVPQAVNAVMAINPAVRKSTPIHREAHREGSLRFLPNPSIKKPKTPASAVSIGHPR